MRIKIGDVIVREIFAALGLKVLWLAKKVVPKKLNRPLDLISLMKLPWRRKPIPQKRQMAVAEISKFLAKKPERYLRDVLASFPKESIFRDRAQRLLENSRGMESMAGFGTALTHYPEQMRKLLLEAYKNGEWRP